jgi:hypothetical protein
MIINNDSVPYNYVSIYIPVCNELYENRVTFQFQESPKI